MINEFDDKGIFKIDQNGTIATMHYVYAGGKYYSLTLAGSKKVERLNTDKSLSMIFMSKNNETKVAEAVIIDDKDVVKDLFDRMIAIEFCHFKKYSDDLVIMEITEV